MSGELLLLIVALLLGYVAGAVPSGLLLGKWLGGKDLRDHGSHNIGFTNAWRVCGPKVAIPVLVIDVGKAYAATAILPVLLATGPDSMLGVLVGISVLLGNLFNAFLGMKGGKGVATALGVFLALAPGAIGICVLLFVVALAVTRYVSLGSILAALSLPATIAWLQGTGPVFWVGLVAAIFVIVKHRKNILRLMMGTENRVGRKRDPAAPLPDAGP